MTHPTTNNAALPLVQTTAPERIYLAVSDEEYDRDRRFLEHDEIGWSTDEPLAVCVPYVRADLATLTQQQGGEQEAGDGDRQARELWARELRAKGMVCEAVGVTYGPWDQKEDAAIRAISAALRTKQPAASEGDVETLARKLFTDQADKLAAPWDRQWEPTKQHWRAKAVEQLNTSKQAAVEAVAVIGETQGELVRKAIARIRELGPWDGKTFDPELTSLCRAIQALPPRHPADEASHG